MLIHATVHRGCTSTVIRESELKADSGGKVLFRIRESNPHQYCAWISARRSTFRDILPLITKFHTATGLNRGVDLELYGNVNCPHTLLSPKLPSTDGVRFLENLAHTKQRLRLQFGVENEQKQLLIEKHPQQSYAQR